MAQQLWDIKDLKCPPVNTFKMEKCPPSLKSLRKTLKRGYDFFSNQDSLDEDAAVLSRLIWRMKMKFRNSKDFKQLQKINGMLRNYLEMDIASSLKMFLQLIPTKGEPNTYLPTRNVIDYVLVRLQGLAKLMTRMVETTSITVGYLHDRIHTGNFWNLAMVMIGLVSRLHVLAKKILVNACQVYRILLPYRKKLQNTNENIWLPKGYKFPKDLEAWLDCSNLTETQNLVTSEAMECSTVAAPSTSEH